MKQLLRRMNALALVIIAIICLMKIPTIANPAEEFVEITVPIVSSDSDKTELVMYHYDNKLLIQNGDLQYLTRVRIYPSRDGNGFSILQGYREIEVNIPKQELSEFGKSSDILVKRHNDKTLIHALPILQYLMAKCEWKDGILQIHMPKALLLSR